MSYTSSPPCGPFTGMTQSQLVSARAAAQNALIALLTGQETVVVTYASGEGNRSVTYARANEVGLRALITEINAALGQGRRRAMPVIFR